jgi:hypothetical protein
MKWWPVRSRSNSKKGAGKMAGHRATLRKETVYNARITPQKVSQFEASLVHDGSRTVDRDYVSIALETFGTFHVLELRPADARELVKQLQELLEVHAR